MTSKNDRFWAKVLFREFIKHYRKMTDEQIVRDVRQSMDDLDDLVDDTDTFGSKMVRWSVGRAEQYPMASENGKKGGRPLKKKETTADGDIREDSLNIATSGNGSVTESGTSATTTTTPCTISADGPRQAEARQSQGRTGAPSTGATSSTAPVRSLRLPTWDEFTAFIDAQGLDYTDAREWWEMTMVDRDGKDRYGKTIANWKGALKIFCKNRAAKRSKGEVK